MEFYEEGEGDSSQNIKTFNTNSEIVYLEDPKD